MLSRARGHVGIRAEERSIESPRIRRRGRCFAARRRCAEEGWSSGRAKQWLEAVRSGEPGRVQGALNTGLGELYRTVPAEAKPSEAKPWEQVATAREPYRFDAAPEDVLLVTCGVDVQGNRLVYVIRGWGYRIESWLLRAGELWGATDQEPVWTELAGILSSDFGGHAVRLMLVDSGFRPEMVYDFARRFPAQVRATKGHDRQDKPICAAQIDVRLRGKVKKSAMQIWHLDSDYVKSWVHGRLNWPMGEPGAFHISQDASDDYCMQLVAESRVVKASGAATWVQIRKDNHFLDAEALAAAGAMMLHAHLAQPAAAAVPGSPPPQPPRGSNPAI